MTIFGRALNKVYYNDNDKENEGGSMDCTFNIDANSESCSKT